MSEEGRRCLVSAFGGRLGCRTSPEASPVLGKLTSRSLIFCAIDDSRLYFTTTSTLSSPRTPPIPAIDGSFRCADNPLNNTVATQRQSGLYGASQRPQPQPSPGRGWFGATSQAGMMNGRHLPAGQQGMPQDMGRRRQYNQSMQYQQTAPVPYGYMNPYHTSYYPPQQLPPQYHNAAGPYQYGPYVPPPPHVRSPPPPMPHYAHPPMPQHPYPRSQASPAMAAPYQPPQPVQTPPSTFSSQPQPEPAPTASPIPQASLSTSSQYSPTPDPLQVPFRAPLPWLSHPDEPWPVRRARRKRRQQAHLSAEPVELPTNPTASDAATLRPETPETSHPTSEREESTNPTTPSSLQHPLLPTPGEAAAVSSKASQRSTVPAVPVIPAIPKTTSKDTTKPVSENASTDSKLHQSDLPETAQNGHESATSDHPPSEELKDAPPPSNAWATPKLWTGLFNPATAGAAGAKNGARAAPANFGRTNTETLAEALRSFSAVASDSKVTFLEPRGLVNTGNMCYMNSVLQVLVFCSPFYSFLDQVGKSAAHSFKSDTPLIDAMIMFMREYSVIDSAATVEQLRLRLKDNELEQYGEPLTPDFVYDVMKQLPRFVTMQRGHQQDAEEFLGFLLDGLHEECLHVLQASLSNSTSITATPTNVPASPTSDNASIAGSVSGKENGWLEVGPKQKQAITRSSGTITTNSPVTRIFGGNLRSELRVPGLKDSVTLEHYQPLQLDIGASNVHNIVDALKGLTRPEALHGDFKSPKGPNVTATKQVFIETVPPVLILHLKRFQFDNTGGTTQKIWKKVGYPLELEMPKEVFPRQKRSVYAHGGIPKYRLIAVVYHHGKNASGGHYTVDVRRQDGREWIRLDDTVIRRVRSEDVAEGGSEEDPKVLAAALEAHKKDSPSSGNAFSAIENGDGAGEGEGDGWKQASGTGKKWSAVANGTSTPKSKSERFSVKDNKVAYLLFYQRI